MENKRSSEMTSKEQEQVAHYVHINQELLTNLRAQSSERLIKSFFLLSAGGIVTILAYLSRTSSPPSNGMLIASLLSFIFGLLCSFYLVIEDFLISTTRLNNYVGRIREYSAGKINYGNINQENYNPSDKLLFFGKLIVLAISLGIAFGLIGFLGSFPIFMGPLNYIAL